MQIIKEGVDYLRNVDFEMFNRLTVQRKYVFLYHKKSKHSVNDIYTINDRYLAHGKEGVVICLVQAVLDRAMKDSLGRFQVKSYGSELQRGRQEIFEFIKRHSFSPQLVNQYQKLAEK